MIPSSLYDLERDDFEQLLTGEPSYRVEQVWSGLYSTASELDGITTVPRVVRSRIAEAAPPALELSAERVSDDGTTTKWLYSLVDGVTIESVLMVYPERATVCVSTQAGCAMACAFCATGQAGFDRNLSTGEIVEQVLRAIRAARPRRVSNVVFMGMGEPLANYDNTLGAVRRLNSAVGISARHLTVSTVGIVPGIHRLALDVLPVNLAVSLHAANDRLRDRLVPINRRYPLDELMRACRGYLALKNRRLSFEWAMIAGVNDGPSDARELAALARGVRAHVNLIPLNPTPGYPVEGSPSSDTTEFRDRLLDLGVNVTVRQSRGNDIDAACGQLRAGTSRGVSEPAQ